MAQKKQAKNTDTQKGATNPKSSYSAIVEKMRTLATSYANLPMESIYAAFGRATESWANMPSVQNSRVKAISPLPADYDKDSLGEFLRYPQNSELPLQQVAEGLKWSVYSFFKLQKSYADILTYRNYVLPEYITAEDVKTETFQREYRLADKLLKAVNIPEVGHLAVGQAEIQGKVFYVSRYRIDKSHNSVDTFFLQPLPTGGGWAKIIGLNNVSKYTVSFNLMYFMTPGTDYRQFGDLFAPYMEDFNDWVTKDQKRAFKGKYIYASRNNAEFESEIKAWCQNGRWYYYVSLPIDRVWTFEIDDTTPITVSPFAGLMQTFSQQADYEAAQLSLIMNPLIKIFTGEIPYYNSDTAKEDDGFRLSVEMRAVFEAFWNQMMAATNTGGTAFYTAPVNNIKSHDYAESANANSISQSFLNYGMAKSGTQGIIPVTDRPSQGVAEVSAKLEARYAQCIYTALEKMINYILGSLNLRYSFKVHIFGDIYSDDLTRSNALKQIDKGDIMGWVILCALDGISLLDKVSMGQVVKQSGLLELLQPPQLSYTQSSTSQSKSDTGGSPTKTETEVAETKIEKQTESVTE